MATVTGRVSNDGEHWVELFGDHDERLVRDELNALPATGGTIYIEGALVFSGTVSRAIDDVTIQGTGLNTRVTCDASTPLFSCGSQDGWRFLDFDTDAGGVEITSGTHVEARYWVDGARNVVDTGSATVELALIDVAIASNRAFLTGDDITYSGARGSAAHKIVATLTAVGGGWSNIYSLINTSGIFNAAGEGIVGIKQVVSNTVAATAGHLLAGQFIAKHDSDSKALAAECPLIGIEAIGYDAAVGSAGVGVMIAGNFVLRSYATSAYGGGVHRGIQIVVDEATLGADEVTALCIWNMGASAVDAIRIAGADTMRNFLYLDAAGASGAVRTGDLVAAHAPDGSSIGADAFLVCAIGATPYYIALYNSKV